MFPVILLPLVALITATPHDAPTSAATTTKYPQLFNTKALAAARPACVHVQAQSHPGPDGYHHWVYIDNRCTLTAVCDVSTDLSPTQITVTVPPARSERVLTLKEAPAKEFTPLVTCTLGRVD